MTLGDDIVKEVQKLLGKNYSYEDIKAATGVSKGSISKISNGEWLTRRKEHEEVTAKRASKRQKTDGQCQETVISTQSLGAVSVRSGTTDVSQIKEIESGVYRAKTHFGRCLTEGARKMTFFDLGGNVGLASRFALQAFGKNIHQHVAVEPIEENATLFKANNPGVDLRIAAIEKTARSKTTTMKLPASDYQKYRCASAGHSPFKNSTERVVPSLSFRKLLEEVCPCSDTLFLKVDCEGPEIWMPEVLATFLDRSSSDRLLSVIVVGELSLDNHPTITIQKFEEFGSQLADLTNWTVIAKSVGKPPPGLDDKGYRRCSANAAVRFEFVLIRKGRVQRRFM